MYLVKKILWAPTERKRPALFSDILGKTKIGDFDIAVMIKENILWLKIPVNNAIVVELEKSQGDLKKIETSLVLIEFTMFGQVGE